MYVIDYEAEILTPLFTTYNFQIKLCYTFVKSDGQILPYWNRTQTTLLTMQFTLRPLDL